VNTGGLYSGSSTVLDHVRVHQAYDLFNWVAEQAVSSGGVDVVFNNAGYGLAGSLEGLSDDCPGHSVET